MLTIVKNDPKVQKPTEAQKLDNEQPTLEKNKNFTKSSRRTFDVRIALQCGIAAAIVFDRILWSAEFHARKQQTDFYHEGKWWMYESNETFHEHLPFLSIPTIKRAVAELKKHSLILSKRLPNRANNYAVTDLAVKNYGNGWIDQNDPTSYEDNQKDESWRDQNDLWRDQNDTSLILLNSTDTPKKGERACAREETPPFDINSLEFETEDQDTNYEPHENRNSPSPELVIELGDSWYRVAKKINPRMRFEASDYCKSIEKMCNDLGYDLEEVCEILHYAFKSKFFTQKFVSHEMPFHKMQNGNSILEEVAIEMKSRKKSKTHS